MDRLLFIVIALLLCNAGLVRAEAIDDHVIPRLQPVVVQKGKIVKAQSYGAANVEDHLVLPDGAKQDRRYPDL